MQLMKWSVIALAVAAGTSQMAVASSQSESKGFVEDSSFDLLNRNFYFNRDYRKDTHKDSRHEWAQGLIGDYQSGFTTGTVGFGADVLAMGGVKLDSGRGREGTGLLPIDGEGRAEDSYGEIRGNVKARISNTTLKYGNAMRPQAPVFATSDSRLLPSTVTGFELSSEEIESLSLAAGHFTASNTKGSSNANEGIYAGYAGVEGESADYFGGSLSANDNLSFTLYGSELQDVWRQYYGNANYAIPLSDEQSLTFDFNLYRTLDEGKSLAGDIDNTTFSLAAAYTLGAHTFTLAHQRVNGDEAFDYVAFGADLDPADSIFLANSVQYSDFNSPNEKSYQLRYDLDMTSYGVPGLSFMARYITGDDIDGTKADVNGAYYHDTDGNLIYGEDEKHWERNLEAKYVIQEGAAKDLSFRLRQATHRSTSGQVDGDIDEFRLITEYPLDIL